MPGIAGAAASLVHNFHDRVEKNKRLLRYRNMILDALEKHYPVMEYAVWKKTHGGTKSHTDRNFTIVVLGPPRADTWSYIPNTVLLSVVDRDRKICNIKIKKLLEDKNVIVSIGSACNTSSKKASHVLESMTAPPEIKRGVLRVSAGDYNTESDIKNFISIFTGILKHSDVWL
jgi:cysteine sulfinate desulfinase/cysteine desulfurase-like protein